MRSVVVLAAEIVRIVFLPPERDPVLLVHANTVLTLPVSTQGFQAVARHRGQILKPLGGVEHRQLPMHNRPQLPRNSARGLAVSLFHRSAVVASANEWIIGSRYTDTVYPSSRERSGWLSHCAPFPQIARLLRRTCSSCGLESRHRHARHTL